MPGLEKGVNWTHGPETRGRTRLMAKRTGWKYSDSFNMYARYLVL